VIVRSHVSHQGASDVAVPSGRLDVLDLPTRPYGSVQVGVGFRTSDAFALRLQVSGHTSPLRIDNAPGLR